MSKGKRKSDPEALSAVYARLRAHGLAISPDAPVFSAADRELLLKLCRLDLIHVIEVELGLGPLKSSQKNSVGGMVHWLLHPRHRQPAAAAPAGEQQVDPEDPEDADAADADTSRPGTSADLRTQGGASSHDASCHTPAQQAQEEEQEAAGATPVHPAWLEDLQHQLAAAAAAAAPSELLADADDSSSNEADSKLAHASWVAAAGAQLALQQQQQLQQQLQWQASQQAPATTAAAAAVAAAPSQGPDDEAAAISQIEQQFLEQLMLDIEAKPSSSLTLPAGRLQQQWEQDALADLALQQQLDAVLQQQQLATPQQGGHMWPQMLMLEMDAPAAPVWPGSSQQVLPTVGSWQRSCELSSGSFHSKRDLRARRAQTNPLPALLQAGMVLPAASAAELLCVEASGPSADLPTKRRSITLPGTAEIAALPTSFSGRLPLVPSVMAPANQPGLMQLSALYDADEECQPAAAADDDGALAWQLQQPMPQEQRRQSRMAGLAHKIGDLLLHGRTKAKAKRHPSGTFGAAPPGTSSIAIKAEAGAAPAGDVWAPAAHLDAAQTQQQQQQQQLMLQGGSLVMPDDGQRLLRDPAHRLWSSAIEVPAHRTDGSGQWPLPEAVGGFSWNAGEAGAQPPSAAAAAAAAAVKGDDFARQLARLRALYGQDDEEIC